MASSVETHPQRQKIIDAILSRQPYRDIEKWADPPVTRGSLSRFARSIQAKTRDAIETAKAVIANKDTDLGPTVTDAVTKAVMTVAVDPFLSRALQADARRERWMAAAEAGEKPDYRALSALDRNDLTSQEYQARLSGRLDTRPDAPTTNLHVYLGIPRLDPGRSVPQQLAPADVEFIDAPADVANKSDESDS